MFSSIKHSQKRKKKPTTPKQNRKEGLKCLSERAMTWKPSKGDCLVWTAMIPSHQSAWVENYWPQEGSIVRIHLSELNKAWENGSNQHKPLCSVNDVTSGNAQWARNQLVEISFSLPLTTMCHGELVILHVQSVFLFLPQYLWILSWSEGADL